MFCLSRLHRRSCHQVYASFSGEANIWHHALTGEPASSARMVSRSSLLDASHEAAPRPTTPEVLSCLPYYLPHPLQGQERSVPGRAVPLWGISVANSSRDVHLWGSALSRSHVRSCSSQVPASSSDSKKLEDNGHADTGAGVTSTTQRRIDSRTDEADRQSAIPEKSSAACSKESRSGSFAQSGWTQQEVLNVPNAISMARLLSGPVIASWIIAGEWQTALIALAISGMESFLITRY